MSADHEHYTVVDSVLELATPVAEELGLELVEVQFRREGRGWVLRLIIDSEAGIGIDQCAAVNREVGRILEVEDFIDHAYNLEVSSPGLDRPLKKREDFERFAGRLAKLTTHEPVDGQHVFVGKIEGMANDAVMLKMGKEVKAVPYSLISKARLEVEF